MIPVLTPVEARALDAAAPVPVNELIIRAGAGLARAAIAEMGGTYGRRVEVIAGPGNNGADAREAAARLRARGARVQIHGPEAVPARLATADLVIDGAFGTGFRGVWEPPEVGDTPVMAVDIPSGLDALTGLAAGRVLPAVATVTFAAGKPGLYLGQGPEVCGRVEVVDIGLDASGAAIAVVTAADVAERCAPRPRTAHKWSAGVRVVAGAPGMTGAARLASVAALRAGAGIVHLSSPGLDGSVATEVVGRPVPGFGFAPEVLADLHRFGSLVIGPGLGRGDHTVPSVVEIISEALCPIVIDGDGLFALGWNDRGPAAVLRARRGPTVLTPHDGEFALLTGRPPGADRIEAARRLASDCDAVVVLKGPTTVVADPMGQALLVTNGSARLATAGTGDVLSGIIGAVLARGMTALWAAGVGAWIHAEAARRAPQAQLIASDLLDALALGIPGVTDAS